MTKNITTESQAQGAIDAWRGDPPRVQLRNLRQAIETLELNQMYYEQKGNENGVKRAERCIAVLMLRKKELGPG